jgi:hypothetical protein
VDKFLACGKYHETFLQMNGCAILDMWIKKHQSGCFPSDPVIETILKALKDLPVTIENLQESGLGRSVNAIANS